MDQATSLNQSAQVAIVDTDDLAPVLNPTLPAVQLSSPDQAPKTNQVAIADTDDLGPLLNPTLPAIQSSTSSQTIKADQDGAPTVDGTITDLTPAQYLTNLGKMSDSRETSPGSDDDDYNIKDFQLANNFSSSYIDLRSGICYDSRMRFHVELVTDDKNKSYHPEDPRRIEAIYSLLGLHGLVENSPYTPATGTVSRPLKKIQSRHATREECCRVHTERHFDDVKSTSEADDETLYKKGLNGDSVYYNQATYSSALLAAGSAIETTRAVVKGEVKNAIAVIRPPGHHSEHDSSGGFCHFDNVAVAVRNVQHEFPAIKKVLVVDWDVHHGNGIQDAFKDDPNVVYISLHVYDNARFYPSSIAGAIEYDGIGKGKGTNINIGWDKQGRTDGDYLLAFRSIIMPIANEFDPDLVMIASGFDAAEGDQLGGCHVSPEGYSQMTHMLMSLADGKVVVCLEGGYNLRSISISALAVTKTLMGQPPARVANPQPTESGTKTVFEVIQHHQRYWSSLLPRDKGAELDGIVSSGRLHDIVRCVQAEQLFKTYRMFPLPINRPSAIPKSKSFEYQALATPDFRNGQELLLIFHEQPQMIGNTNPVTGVLSLSTPKLIDPVAPFIDWGIKKRFEIIDINLPDFYTGISKDNGEDMAQHNKQISLQQMQIVSTYIWDNFVATSAARKIVLLGVGNAFLAVQRIIATHSIEAFVKQSVRAIGAISGEVPGAYIDPHLSSYEYYWPLWTKIWVPKTNKIFKDAKNGRPKKKFGTVVASDHESLNDLLALHEREIRSEILVHFERAAETSSGSASDGETNGVEKAGSDSSSKSILGKRERDDDGETARSTRVRLSEER